jgi:hypothetical protein
MVYLGFRPKGEGRYIFNNYAVLDSLSQNGEDQTLPGKPLKIWVCHECMREYKRTTKGPRDPRPPI